MQNNLKMIIKIFSTIYLSLAVIFTIVLDKYESNHTGDGQTDHGCLGVAATVDLVHNGLRMRKYKKLPSISLSHPF